MEGTQGQDDMRTVKMLGRDDFYLKSDSFLEDDCDEGSALKGKEDVWTISEANTRVV